MAIKINGINHVAISVADFEEALRSPGYGKGYLDLQSSTVQKSPVPASGFPICRAQAFCLKSFVRRMARRCRRIRKVPNLDLLTQGNKHFSFGVKDAHKAKDELAAMGVEIAMIAEVDGTYGVFIRDNTGNLIEIFEEEIDRCLPPGSVALLCKRAALKPRGKACEARPCIKHNIARVLRVTGFLRPPEGAFRRGPGHRWRSLLAWNIPPFGGNSHRWIARKSWRTGRCRCSFGNRGRHRS